MPSKDGEKVTVEGEGEGLGNKGGHSCGGVDWVLSAIFFLSGAGRKFLVCLVSGLAVVDESVGRRAGCGWDRAVVVVWAVGGQQSYVIPSRLLGSKATGWEDEKAGNGGDGNIQGQHYRILL